jgi:hypothetical protein
MALEAAGADTALAMIPTPTKTTLVRTIVTGTSTQLVVQVALLAELRVQTVPITIMKAMSIEVVAALHHHLQDQVAAPIQAAIQAATEATLGRHSPPRRIMGTVRLPLPHLALPRHLVKANRRIHLTHLTPLPLAPHLPLNHHPQRDQTPQPHIRMKTKSQTVSPTPPVLGIIIPPSLLASNSSLILLAVAMIELLPRGR